MTSTDADEGWSQLAAGRWTPAAERFDAALALDPDDPRALEGRAWAAWWLDDAPTLFDTRERAYHAYRATGDANGAARAAIWLACDHNEIRGEHAVANGWYQRAHRLLDGIPTSLEHGWLAFQEGAYAVELADDTATGKRRAAEAIAIARSLGSFDLEFLALSLEGLALVTEGQVEEGLRRLDEAGIAATSGEVTERIAVNWTLCYLVYACERVRDFDRLAQWCRRMEDVAIQYGFEAGVGICRVRYGSVLMFHGEWDQAEAELERSRRIFAAARPLAVAESDARFGELRRRQGRREEARALLSGAQPHPLAVLGLACLALDEGDATAAAGYVEDLLATTPDSSVTQLVDANHLLAVTYARLGRLDEARAASARLEAMADKLDNLSVHAMAAVAVGEIALAESDLQGARRSFTRAVDLFDRGGLPYEAALARGSLASVLAHLDKRDQAAALAEEAAAQLRALGAGPAAERIGSAIVAGAPLASGDDTVPGLTARESEVLALLAEGLKDREIAERLTISPHTVHRHVANILTKLGVSSRAAAVAHGVRHGLRG